MTNLSYNPHNNQKKTNSYSFSNICNNVNTQLTAYRMPYSVAIAIANRAYIKQRTYQQSEYNTTTPVHKRRFLCGYS